MGRCYRTFTWIPMQTSCGPADLSPVASFPAATTITSQLQALNSKRSSKLHPIIKPSAFCNPPKLVALAGGDFTMSTLASADGTRSGLDMYGCSGFGSGQYIMNQGYAGLAAAWPGRMCTMWSLFRFV